MFKNQFFVLLEAFIKVKKCLVILKKCYAKQEKISLQKRKLEEKLVK